MAKLNEKKSLNGTRRAQNEKFITRALLRLGALKWNYYALQIGNFWIRFEYGIVWMLNVIRIFFFRWRNKVKPSSLPWILYSRWQSRSKVFSRALNSALTRLYDACSVANISRGVVGTGVNPDTCGRANSIGRRNFWIRKEIVADSKIAGYVWRRHEWTLEWLAIQWSFAKWYSSIWPGSTKSLFVSGTSINAKCTNDTYVKARPKRMAAVIFRDIATNCFD